MEPLVLDRLTYVVSRRLTIPSLYAPERLVSGRYQVEYHGVLRYHPLIQLYASPRHMDLSPSSISLEVSK